MGRSQGGRETVHGEAAVCVSREPGPPQPRVQCLQSGLGQELQAPGLGGQQAPGAGGLGRGRAFGSSRPPRSRACPAPGTSGGVSPAEGGWCLGRAEGEAGRSGAWRQQAEGRPVTAGRSLGLTGPSPAPGQEGGAGGAGQAGPRRWTTGASSLGQLSGSDPQRGGGDSLCPGCDSWAGQKR